MRVSDDHLDAEAGAATWYECPSPEAHAPLQASQLSGNEPGPWTSTTPDERALFGFPRPGDPSWDARTLRHVRLSHLAMDTTPNRSVRP